MDFKRYEPENFNTLLGHPEGRFMLVADHLAVMEEKDLEWFNKYKERGEQIAARSQAIDKWERIYKEDTTALQAETVRQAEEIERYQEALEEIKRLSEEQDLRKARQAEEFQEAVKPLVKWLNENCHPHVTVVVDCGSAELMEGIRRVVIEDYIKD